MLKLCLLSWHPEELTVKINFFTFWTYLVHHFQVDTIPRIVGELKPVKNVWIRISHIVPWVTEGPPFDCLGVCPSHTSLHCDPDM